MSCVQSHTKTPTSSPTAPFTFVFPELLRDTGNDARDRVSDALENLDEDLGGGVLEVHALKSPMSCWQGQRAIPYQACHVEAQQQLQVGQEDGLIWGYVLNAEAQVFTVFTSARGGLVAEPLKPSGPGGMLTRRDFLEWFRGLVLARIDRDKTSWPKARRLREQLLHLAQAKPTRKGQPTWGAEVPLFAGDISLLLADKGAAPGEIAAARKAYARALELTTNPSDPTARWAAELGLASAELGLGSEQRSSTLLHSAARRFADVRAHSLIPNLRTQAQLGEARALAGEGELTSDPQLLMRALLNFEAFLTTKAAGSEPQRSAVHGLVCRTAVTATRLSINNAADARKACERAVKSIAPAAGACQSLLEASLHADLGELLLLEARTSADLELLQRASAQLQCARTFPGFSEGERSSITHNLARSLQELGTRQRQPPALRQAAALYRTLLAVPSELDEGALRESLGLTLALLGQLEPTVLTLSEALAEFERAFLVGSARARSPETLLQRARAKLQLAGLSKSGELELQARSELNALAAQLDFRRLPKLWLDTALLQTFASLNRPETTGPELTAAKALSELCARRANTLFPEFFSTAELLSELLSLRIAVTSKDSARLCLALAHAQASLKSHDDTTSAANSWPNLKGADLAADIERITAGSKLTTTCRKILNAPVDGPPRVPKAR